MGRIIVVWYRKCRFDFRSPFVDSNSAITQYVGIAGNETPWGGTRRLSHTDLMPAEDWVIWFVEAANSDIKWSEPRDVPLEQASAGINAARGGIHSNYSDGLPVQMFFWDIKWVPLDLPVDEFRAMLTVPKKDRVTTAEKGGD